MRPVDAVWHWFASKFDTDQFLVYAFAGATTSVDDAVQQVIDRAAQCRDFTLQIRTRNLNLRFPAWTPGAAGPKAVVTNTEQLSWQQCLDELATRMDDQLDPRTRTWRLHVFSHVDAVPHSSGPSTVVVLQISHALGDGLRTAALAGWLFGRSSGPAAFASPERRPVVRRFVDAYRARKSLLRDTDSGAVPPAKAPVPRLRTNAPLAGRRILRTIACRPDELPGPTVLVGALVAVSQALSSYLAERGDDVSALTADVAIAKPGRPRARNHFVTVPVGLYPDVPATERHDRIVADLMAARRRISHDAFRVNDVAYEAIPAIVRRLSVWRLSADTDAQTVPANTVVSSVDRGPADLSFGGRPVFLTASYPSLMPMLGLTHGVHRIGDTVAVSVHTTEHVIPDIDDYLDRLDHALRGHSN